MRRSSRLLCIAKWLGTVATILLFAALLLSYRYRLHVILPIDDGTRRYGFSTGDGVAGLDNHWSLGPDWTHVIFETAAWDKPELLEIKLSLSLSPPYIRTFSLWIPLVIAAMPTIMLWRDSRRQCPRTRWNVLDVLTIIIFSISGGILSALSANLPGLPPTLYGPIYNASGLLFTVSRTFLVFGTPGIVLAGLATFVWIGRSLHPGDECCPRCKYNLTGNLSGRCPECGSLIIGRTPPSAQ